jgi:hypothetical protein
VGPITKSGFPALSMIEHESDFSSPQGGRHDHVPDPIPAGRNPRKRLRPAGFAPGILVAEATLLECLIDAGRKVIEEPGDRITRSNSTTFLRRSEVDQTLL